MAATRGHLEVLNLILGHNVDVTASDAAGKFVAPKTLCVIALIASRL